MNKKSITIRILEKVLAIMARTVLWRHRPFVIGITGSVGKTTTKDMIVHILKNHKDIYYTKKNYNNEIGVPMTILGIENNINSLGRTFSLIFVWIKIFFSSNYPEIIVLEMGVDRPGDMDYLISIVVPDISVLTAITYAHSEFFDDIEQIAQEKQKIITKMKKGGTGIINYDDAHVRKIMKKISEHIITYGKQKKAEFIATDIDVCFHQCHATGLSFKLNYKGKTIPVRLNNIIAEHFVYATLAGLAVADTVGINIVEVINDIADFQVSPGRMRLLEGNNAVTVIDDTYNASPQSMSGAIKTLGDSPGIRKIAVLGDMRELGNISKKEHQNVAEQLQKISVNLVFLVGGEMKYTYEILKKEGVKVKYYNNSDEVGSEVTNAIKSGDVILVKGSRGIAMEKIVATLVTDKSQTLYK